MSTNNATASPNKVTLSQKMRAAGGTSPSPTKLQAMTTTTSAVTPLLFPSSPDKRTLLPQTAISSSPDKLPSLASPKDRFVAALMRDAERTVHESSLAYRHSSTANFLGSSPGPYVDVGMSLHPSALCVRCASHASICVPCGEHHTNEALAFYRKSIGAGASAILVRAITEAGLGTTVKAFCFQLWRNGLKAQEAHLNVVSKAVATNSDRKYMKGPFEAWRKFAKQVSLSHFTRFTVTSTRWASQFLSISPEGCPGGGGVVGWRGGGVAGWRSALVHSRPLITSPHLTFVCILSHVV